jgi:excisionase family DNA binding protein
MRDQAVGERAEPRLLPIDEAGRRLGIGRTKTCELIAKGDLVARKLGARTLVEEAELHRFIGSLPVVRSL